MDSFLLFQEKCKEDRKRLLKIMDDIQQLERKAVETVKMREEIIELKGEIDVLKTTSMVLKDTLAPTKRPLGSS